MKFKNGFFDPSTGISHVTITHKGVTYEGRARLHPEEEVASNILGCIYAETRATIKALKAEYKIKKQEYKICENFVKSVSQYKNFDRESPTAKAMYRQLNMRRKAMTNISSLILQYKQSLIETAKTRSRMERFVKQKELNKSEEK